MKTMHINTDAPYDVLIQDGILDQAGALVAQTLSSRRTVIVTDDTVDALYGDRLRQSLRRAGIASQTFVFPHGEPSKSLDTLSQLYSFLAGAGITRKDFIVALGGGVVGDLAGFGAASWLRGIAFVQIPTTLLAQVDSSVGGKTGVDIPDGKNLVGAFHQPQLVLCDPQTLQTLPPQTFSDGMAEVIKYGVIFDKDLFDKIDHNPIENILQDVIASCIDWKRRVVEQDAKEAGERMKLNFGHTLGHAIERIHRYVGITHGQGVAIGMTVITRLSEKYKISKPGTANRIQGLLEKFSLPTSTEIPAAQLVENSLGDKKRGENDITIVLAPEIGRSVLLPLPLKDYRKFVLGDYQ